MMKTFVLFSVSIAILSGCASKRVDETSVDHEEIKKNIRLTVGANRGRFESCYYRAIDERPGADGKITMAWEIDGKGKAQNVKAVQADEKIKHIEPCLAEVIRSLEFQRTPGDDSTVDIQGYPFAFSENGKYQPKTSSESAPKPAPQPPAKP